MGSCELVLSFAPCASTFALIAFSFLSFFTLRDSGFFASVRASGPAGTTLVLHCKYHGRGVLARARVIMLLLMMMMLMLLMLLLQEVLRWYPICFCCC